MKPPLEAAAGEPHGEAVRIVVAAVVRLAAHEAAAHFDHRRAAELRAGNDDGFVEEAARFQILDERRERLIGVVARLAMHLDVEVVIPRIALGVVDLHHAHAALDEPRRGQAAARRAAFAVHLNRRCDLLAHVEDIGSLGLHADTQSPSRRWSLRAADRARRRSPSSCSVDRAA